MRKRLSLLTVIGFVLAASTAAFAVWTVPSSYAASNYALAKASALSAPTGPTATGGAGAVTVGWTPAATQLAGAEYRVTRSSGPGSPATVCTVAPAVTSCQDTGLAAGTAYGYSIAAILGAWQSSSAIASATTTGTSQTITFTSTAPQNGTVGGATYTVAATASSGLAVSFSLDATSSGCSISGSTVTFTAAGTCKINANQAGNAQYLAAPQVQQTINATPVAGMIFTSVKVNGSTVTPTCTANSTIGTTYTCQTTGGSNATLAANVTFANTSGTATVFSASQASIVSATYTRNPGPATVTIPLGGHTSGTAVTTAKQGNQSSQVTVTFGGWTAVLVIN